MTPHRGFVAVVPGPGPGGVQFQGFCHDCRWEGDPTGYEPLAREQVKSHTNDKGEQQ